MYVPAHFEENRPDTLRQLIERHPLGTLVNVGENGLDANHVPFEFDAAAGPHGTLRTHVARANPLWREAAGQPEALVIFQGPSAYISPNWYPSKHEAHRLVPTYNYMVVHAHGRMVIREDEAFLRGLVARLTRRMEAQAGEARPWRMGEAPPEFIAQLLGHIVGIEIEVTRLIGKWKLSQNRDARDRLGAIAALEALGDDESRAVAAAMRAAPPELG